MNYVTPMADTKPKYTMYEVMKVKSENNDLIASIRGMYYDKSLKIWLYALRAIDKRTVEARESELEATGEFEAPLRYDEIVEIWPKEEKHAYLSGKRGVVEGISIDDKTEVWYFSVSLQTGEVWCFSKEELQSSGRFLPQSVKDIIQTQALKVRVDADSSEGILVEGDPSVNIYQYVPYPVNLDDL